MTDTVDAANAHETGHKPPTEELPAAVDDAAVDDAAIDAAITAEAAAAAPEVALPLSATPAADMKEQFAVFRSGWLRDMQDSLTVATAPSAAAGVHLRLSLGLVRKMIDELRVCLAPILLSQPRFVITCMGKFDVPSWAVTMTPKQEQTYDTFLAPTARMKVTTLTKKKKNSKTKQHHEWRAITQEEKDVAWVISKWMNNDWVIGPVLAFLVRSIEPAATCAELPTPHPPVLQFIDAQGEQQSKNMFHHQKMVAVRLPLDCASLAKQTAVEVSEGQSVCIDMLTGNSTIVEKDNCIVQDVDMALFLMWNRLKKVQKGLEAFTDLLKFSIDVWGKLCAAVAAANAAAAASAAAADTRDEKGAAAADAEDAAGNHGHGHRPQLADPL
jgi:hypothetical protein